MKSKTYVILMTFCWSVIALNALIFYFNILSIFLAIASLIIIIQVCYEYYLIKEINYLIDQLEIKQEIQDETKR